MSLMNEMIEYNEVKNICWVTNSEMLADTFFTMAKSLKSDKLKDGLEKNVQMFY